MACCAIQCDMSCSNDPNVLFLRYEDMQKDLPATIRRIAKFADFQLTPKLLATVTEMSSFKFMKVGPTRPHAEQMFVG
jgi:hypothetical protein